MILTPCKGGLPTHHLESGDGPGEEVVISIMVASLHLSSNKGQKYRVSLPSEEDDDIEDVQHAGPLLFSKCRTQSRELAGSSDISSISVSSVRTGQHVLDDSQEDELNGNQPHPEKRKKD